METGKVVVEKVENKSTVTRCFSKYPLKFIFPNKVGPSNTDAVWIYTLSYGGGIVSGDSISCEFVIGGECTAVLTTQASTKVYKSMNSKCSEQFLEARIGGNALFVVVPDPVTCFATARYSQKQVFRLLSDSNLLLVDWITSGRHESGEKWAFDLYKSANQIFLDDDKPLFLDTVLLEQASATSIAARMHGYQNIAMVVMMGPKLTHLKAEVAENVKKIMSEKFHKPYVASTSDPHFEKPPFVASCSSFGPKGIGLVVRIASTTTEAVYKFLRTQLTSLEPLIGVVPYH